MVDSNVYVAGFQFDLVYEPAALTISAITDGDGIPQEALFGSNPTFANDKIRFVFVGLAASQHLSPGPQHIVAISFDIATNAPPGVYSFTAEEVIFSSPNALPILMTITDGSVTVVSAGDNDGDGYVFADDCDDSDDSVHPGASEICDGLDNDCNSQIDDGVLNTWYLDEDGDGYGNQLLSVQDCQPPEGYVADMQDCDDSNADIHPAGTEIADDGIDQDCDGEDLQTTDTDSETTTDSDTTSETETEQSIDAEEQPAEADDASDVAADTSNKDESGCSTTGRGEMSFWLALVGLFLLRRTEKNSQFVG